MTIHVRRLRATAIVATAIVAVSLSSALAAGGVSNGQPDPHFGTGGIARLGNDTELLGVATQADGKIVAVGAEGISAGSEHLLVARFTTGGALDPSFHGGQVTGPANVIGRAVAVQADGKIVVAGQATNATGQTSSGMVVERFTSSGSPDGGFGSNGVATALAGDPVGAANAVALQTNGGVVLAGSGAIKGGANAGFPGLGLARFNANGSRDSGFGSGGSEVVDLGRFSVANGVAIQGDGKIVVGGSQREGLQTTSVLAARVSTSGALDHTFAGGLFLKQYAVGAGYSAFNAVALQPDGRVVLAGGALDGTAGINTVVVRLTTGGGLDGGFGSGGAVKLPAANFAQAANIANPPVGAQGVAVSAGRIFAAGWFDNQGAQELALWGLTGSGAPDGSFGSGGRTLISAPGNVEDQAIAVIPGGNLAVAGFLQRISLIPNATGYVGRFGGPTVSTTPAISHLKVSPGSFRAASHGGSIAAATGSTVSYLDSLPAVTTFSVLAPNAGVKSGKRCVKPPRHIHGHPHRCSLAVGSFTVDDIAGGNTFTFTGRIGGHKLATGSYTLQAVPKFGRATGRAASTGFKIVH